MNWTGIQTRLGVIADGVAGPRTWAAVFDAMAGHPLEHRSRDLGVGADQYFSRYRLTTPLRIAHFLGQTCHESGGYRWLRELWGPTIAQINYEKNLRLGNTLRGDGERYLGRGIIQITGKGNYREASNRIGIDLVANPELAERPDIAVLTACDFWAAHELNALADDDDVHAVTRKINGGLNGIAERLALTAKAKAILA